MAQKTVARFVDGGEPGRGYGALVERSRLFAAAAALAEAGVGPVSVEQPAYVFQPTCPEADRLAAALRGGTADGSI
jgi:ATP phosphoribosyltransferase